MPEKAVVGMSGGVDSAVAALLLLERGYEVVGVTLKTWSGESSRCCEIDAARNIAQKLKIKFHTWNVSDRFEEQVVLPFKHAYVNGLTPNPCIRCNRSVKWTGLIHAADVVGAKFVATGHYAELARLDNGRFAVGTARDATKDQSYMLYNLTQEQLARTLFPLGRLSKTEVRQIAADNGLAVADKPDSQEICFVTQGSYADYIGERAAVPGNFVDMAGRVLGRHKGIIHYTVGQRRGLNLALGYPAYVQKIKAAANEVVIGDAVSLCTDTVYCDELNFMGRDALKPGETETAVVKIRYRHPGAEAVLTGMMGDRVKITFVDTVRAAAPGQAAVFYDAAGFVIGGGTISDVAEEG